MKRLRRPDGRGCRAGAIALCTLAGGDLGGDRGDFPPTASSPRTWLVTTVICFSKSKCGPYGPVPESSWGWWSRVGSGQFQEYRPCGCRLCLWDTWNPGSSLDLGSLLRKPQPREGKAPAQGHTGGLEPSSPSVHSTFHCTTLRGWERFYPWTRA